MGGRAGNGGVDKRRMIIQGTQFAAADPMPERACARSAE